MSLFSPVSAFPISLATLAYLLWKIARTTPERFSLCFICEQKKVYFNFKLNCKQQQPAAGGVY